MVGSARRLSEELLLRRRRALGRVLDDGWRRGGAAAMARARLWRRARLRRRRGRVAHGGGRAFLQRRGVRRRAQLSGDLARARLALPLAAHADFGRDGGAGARADWAKASLGTQIGRASCRERVIG